MNSLVWFYDNFEISTPVENIKFILEILDYNFKNVVKNINSFNNDKIHNTYIGYPDIFEKEYCPDKNSTVFTWNINTMLKNEFKKISLDLPFFNDKCRKLVKIYFYNI